MTVENKRLVELLKKALSAKSTRQGLVGGNHKSDTLTFTIMRIVIEKPPVWDECVKAFGLKDDSPVVFAYGDAIYNPTGAKLTLDVIHHEEVHQRQQGEDPRDWWEKYIADSEFRVNQEAEAYGAQYRFIRSRKRSMRTALRYLHHFATSLSGSTYGNCISYNDACKLIIEESHKE